MGLPLMQGNSGRKAGTGKRGAPGWDSPKTHSSLTKLNAARRVATLVALRRQLLQQGLAPQVASRKLPRSLTAPPDPYGAQIRSFAC